MKKQANRKNWKVITLIIILALAAGCAFYVSDYYRALPEALAVVSEPAEGIIVTEEKNDRIVFEPEDALAGLIFYPGGKVQYESYAPLMEALAEKGILCVLLHMPGNLAVLDMNAADGVKEQFPKVERWYIGGHSLGGTMAASYAAGHADEFEGLILLASYTTENLKESGLKVISVYGSEDGVLNRSEYEKCLENLPDDFFEHAIAGGNHAFFGSYGLQDGDGTATITNEEQKEAAVEAILGQLFVQY